jgi:hypothetical protein
MAGTVPVMAMEDVVVGVVGLWHADAEIRSRTTQPRLNIGIGDPPNG